MRSERSCALPMFHAFTGCDTVSAFVGGGKKTCWEVWNKYPDVTEVFNELSKLPPFISNTFLTAIECFTVRLYDFSSHSSSVNSTRRKLFSQKGRTIENIPPTQDALGLHLKRAFYQAGHVWSQALVPLPVLPNPEDWGWALCDGLWQPLWMTLPDAAKCCPELKRCGCGTGCSTKRCRCFKDNLPCTVGCIEKFFSSQSTNKGNRKLPFDMGFKNIETFSKKFNVSCSYQRAEVTENGDFL